MVTVVWSLSMIPRPLQRLMQQEAVGLCWKLTHYERCGKTNVALLPAAVHCEAFLLTVVNVWRG